MIPKFRAWFGSEMYDKPVVYNGEFYLDWRDFEDGRTYDGAVLMQSTGLFDKNGKEIFEGDVVKIVEENGDSEISAVAFKDGALGMTIIEVFVPFAAMSILSTVDYTLEVIGNIYENLELVEEATNDK